MALRDDLGESVTGVDTSRAMLEKFDRKAEGRGVTTVAVEVRPDFFGRTFFLLIVCFSWFHVLLPSLAEQGVSPSTRTQPTLRRCL